MKIIFTIPSLYGGGAERVMKYLVENINANEKILCTLESGQKYSLDKKIKYKRLTNIDGRSSLVKKLSFFLLQYFKFVFFIYKEKPDMIISFLERSNIITILTPTKAKKVISIRSFISKKFYDTGLKGKLVKFSYKLLFKKVDNFVVPTKEIKNDLIESFNIKKHKIDVIYNPIDLNNIDLLKKEKLDKEHSDLFMNSNILINVGNLTHPKGQWHLIKVFAELKKTNKKIKLIIIGEGNYLEFLVSVASNLKLKIYNYKTSKLMNDSYDIYFLGFQSNPYKFLYNSDLFIFSSLREGFPNAVIEAMACDLPIVSANCQSGPKEILDEGKYGLLLPEFSGLKNRKDLDDIELLWVKEIDIFLKENLTSYKKLSLKRVVDFNLKKIMKIWEYYIKGLN